MFYQIKIDFKKFYKEIITNKKYYVPILLFLFIAYGFSLFCRTISYDDMAYTYFFNERHAMIAGMKWGAELLEFILPKEYTPFICRFMSVAFMAMSGTMISFIVYSLNNKTNTIWSYTILTSLFTTYPLVNEMYEFFSFVYDPFNILLCTFCLVLQLYSEKIESKTLLIEGMLITPSMSGVESVVGVYVSLVFMILYIKELKRNKKEKKYNWLIDGLKYTLPLFIALVLRTIIGKLLINILNTGNLIVGNGYIKWFSDGIKSSLLSILNNGWYYIVRGLSYFPIGEFVIALVFFVSFSLIQSLKEKSNVLIIGFFLILSLFTISIVQGEYLHYRIASPIYVFVGFCAYLFVDLFNKDKYKKIAIVLMLLVAFKQSVYLHELLALNNQRSENEAYIARQIGYKIYSEFDKDKIVVFCGEYQLGDFIESQIIVKNDSFAKSIEDNIRRLVGHDEGRLYQEYVCTNINSYFNKQMDAFNGQVMLKRYLSYYGFDINVLENLNKEEEKKLKGYYENIAKEEGMKPYEIRDMGDYILVYLGPTIDGYSKLEY